MRRLLIAVMALGVGGALMRAEDSALSSLLGMAEAAKADRGPDPGDLPKCEVSFETRRVGPEQPALIAPRPGEELAAAAELTPEAGLRDAVADPALAAPPVPAAPPRPLTRLLTRLTPPLLRAEGIPVLTASTGTVRAARPRAPDAEAALEGQRRGLVEFMSSAAAPSLLP